MISINNEYKAGIGLAAFVIARFVQVDGDRDWPESYPFDRCWDLGKSAKGILDTELWPWELASHDGKLKRSDLRQRIGV